MKAAMTVVEMLETLRGQVEFHRSQEELHRQQELHHREERTRHASELEAVTKRYEALRAAVEEAQEVLRAPEPAPTPVVQAPDDSDLGPNPKVGKLFVRVLAGWPVGVPFGATAFSEAVSRRRYNGKLTGDSDVRSASLFLRRRMKEGRLESVREGRSYHEALYRKPGGEG